MQRILTLLLLLSSCALAAQITTVWNPAANPDGNGLWSEAANWTEGNVPDGNYKVVFNVPGAPDCRLDDERTINQFVLGDNDTGETLRVLNGGSVSTASEIWSAVGYNDTARLIVETGGTVNFGQHMWIGLIAGGNGTVELNGGTINVGAQTGLGWDGGVGFVYVNDGVLNMAEINPSQSIGDGSLLEIGNGTVNITGDQTGAINGYITAGKIVGRGGNMLSVVFDADNNMTVVTAAAVAQATTVWNPGANPDGNNLWTEAANWTDGFVPDGNKVVFNVPDAPAATLNAAAPEVGQFVLGDNGPGGTLVVASGGSLTSGNTIWSAVGYNDAARLVVEDGGEVTFGEHMWVGLIAGGDGTVEINGGTVNVGQMTGLGWEGGTGKLTVNDGIVNMNGFDAGQSIGDGSLIEMGDGTIFINGDQRGGVEGYIAAGKIVALNAADSLLVAFDETTNRTVLKAIDPTAVGEVIIPGQASLAQNYPNPFSARTNLRFSLRESARVQLSVYTADGRLVASLLDERRVPGEHQVEWDATGLPAGVYVVRLATEQGTVARQVNLTR